VHVLVGVPRGPRPLLDLTTVELAFQALYTLPGMGGRGGMLGLDGREMDDLRGDKEGEDVAGTASLMDYYIHTGSQERVQSLGTCVRTRWSRMIIIAMSLIISSVISAFMSERVVHCSYFIFLHAASCAVRDGPSGT